MATKDHEVAGLAGRLFTSSTPQEEQSVCACPVTKPDKFADHSVVTSERTLNRFWGQCHLLVCCLGKDRILKPQ